MKTLLLIAILFTGLQPVQSQSQENLTPFSKILIKGNLEVELVASEKSSIEIERGEDHRIDFFMKDDQLVVRHRDMYKYRSYRDFPIKVKIAYVELRELDVRAGARVRANESISGIRLDLHFGSGGQFKGDVQVEKIDIDVAEGAIVELTGRANRLTGIASTGGHLEALDVQVDDSRIRSTMGGIAKISAYKSLDAKANLGGKIIYAGKPEQFVINNDLGGVVCKKN